MRVFRRKLSLGANDDPSGIKQNHLQPIAVPHRSKTQPGFSPTPAFLNREFEHRLDRSNGACLPAPSKDQIETPLVIHAMSNSYSLSGNIALRRAPIYLRCSHQASQGNPQVDLDTEQALTETPRHRLAVGKTSPYRPDRMALPLTGF